MLLYDVIQSAVCVLRSIERPGSTVPRAFSLRALVTLRGFIEELIVERGYSDTRVVGGLLVHTAQVGCFGAAAKEGIPVLRYSYVSIVDLFAAMLQAG